MINSKLKYHLLAILTVIIWGVTFVNTKILINNGLTPVEIFFLRFLLAYLCIIFFAPKKIVSKNIKDEFYFLLLGFFGGSLYFITENMALGVTLASNVSLIVCTSPLLTILLSLTVSKKNKISKNIIYGSIISFIGVALVVFNGAFILKINPLGDFLTFIAALSWAIYGLLLKKMENKYSILFTTRKVFFYGLLTVLPFLLYDSINFDFSVLVKPIIGLNLIFLGIIASMLCFFMWNLSVKKLGVVSVTNYIYIIPLVTLLASSIVLDENITIIAIIGSVCILLGVYIAQKQIKYSKSQ